MAGALLPRLARRVGVLVALALTAAGASATIVIPAGTVKVENASGGVRVIDGTGGSAFIGRNFNTSPPAGAPPGSIGVNETHRIGMVGRELQVVGKRAIPRGAILTAAALAERAVLPVAVGVALWELWDDYRVRPDGSGGLIHDPGVAQQATQGWCSGQHRGTPTTRCYADLGAAQAGVDASWDYCTGTNPTICNDSVIQQCVQESPTQHRCKRVRTSVYTYTNGTVQTYGPFIDDSNIIFYAQTVNACPASIDPLDPAYNIPAGAPPDEDGKCRQARHHWQPITPEAAAQIPETAPWTPPTPAELVPIAEDLMTRGQPIPGASDRTMEGPAHTDGTPTSRTETGPSGTTTTTTVERHVYTYNGDTINYRITNVTYTCVGASACSEETADETTEETKGDEESKDPCNLNPERIGCLELGEPPEDEVPTDERTIEFAPVSLGLPEACPAPIPLPNGGELSYQTMCDGLVSARPLIIALGFFAAGAIMIAGLRV